MKPVNATVRNIPHSRAVEWDKDYPKTYGPSEQVQKIFDPSMRYRASAHRPAEPELDEPLLAQWRVANRTAMQRVLSVVAESPWRNHLVLRGSSVLAVWYGDRAREPHDLDWVVQPDSMGIHDLAAQQLERGIINAVCAQATGDELVQFNTQTITTENLWTYDRVPGRRLCFPWKSPGLPSASVQMDIVYNETLLTPPEATKLSLVGNDGPSVLVASREESLAWKLLWLSTDQYPQGKDLFDAVLLAENVSLPEGLFEVVMERYLDSAPNVWRAPELSDSHWRTGIISARVDWKNFLAEMPAIEGTPEAWLARLYELLNAKLKTS